MKNRSPGLTIPEVIIATSLLGLLSVLCLSIYVVGVRAWTKTDQRTELMSILQTAQDRISTEVRSSQFPTVSVAADNTGLAFLWAGPDGSREVDNGGRLLWKDFLFYYTLAGDDKLYRKSVPYAVPDQALMTTLEVFTALPLATHMADGRVVSRNLTKFEATLEAPDFLRVLIRAKVKDAETELESLYQLTPEP